MVTVVSTSVGIWARVNTTYSCVSPASFSVGGANVTFSDMKMEAYMPGDDLSPTGTSAPVCVCVSGYLSVCLSV